MILNMFFPHSIYKFQNDVWRQAERGSQMEEMENPHFIFSV